jgi:hypothetical protein
MRLLYPLVLVLGWLYMVDDAYIYICCASNSLDPGGARPLCAILATLAWPLPLLAGTMSMSDLDAASSVGHSTAWDHYTRTQDVMSADGHGPPSSYGPGSPALGRSSVDSPGRASVSKYRDSIQLAVERAETASLVHADPPTLVEPTFDESVLRALCDLDVRVRDRLPGDRR